LTRPWVIVVWLILSAILCVACNVDKAGDDEDHVAADDDNTYATIDDEQAQDTDYCSLVTTSGDGRREDCHGVTVVHVSGSPYEMGFQTGALMRPEITALIQLVRTVIDPLGLAWGLFQDLPGVIRPEIRPEFVEEMQGVVDGLNNDITYQEILTGNCLGDIFGAIRSFLDNYTDVDWCSLTASWGDATADGELVVTRNFDYMNTFSTANYVAVVTPDQGHAYVTTGIAGLIGIHAGMNENGLTGALAYNSSYDSDMHGVPMLFLLREAVQYADSVEEAEDMVIASDRTMGLNYMFTDGFTTEASVLEVSGAKYAVREAEDKDYLVATNHYMSPDMLDQQRGYEPTHTTMVRYARLTQLLDENYGRVDMTVAGRIMRDHFDSLLGMEKPGRVTVCRHDDLDYPEGSLMNRFVSTSTPSILMKPVEGRYCTTVTKHACEMPYFCFSPFE